MAQHLGHRKHGWIYNNSLLLVMFGAFAVFAGLQSVFGWQVRNEELTQAGKQASSFGDYLGTGHFAEALFENWESEFLQMGAYVLLTVFLFQKGSPESKTPGEKDRHGDLPRDAGPASPAPSRHRGLGQFVYRNSLSLALLSFFLLSMAGHLLGGAAAYNEQQALATGQAPISVWEFLGKSQFWFQSMQNWQSEFLAVGALVALSIVLRQHGSPQSKPVTAAHSSNK